jgi:hypothetical protein
MSALQNIKCIHDKMCALVIPENDFCLTSAEAERLWKGYRAALELLSPEERSRWNEILKE